MKNIIKNISMVLMLILMSASCSDFDEINQRPNAFSSDEVSAKYFLTSTQIRLYAPDRYPYWRAQLIHADRFSGQFTFGHHGSWWSDGLSYSYSSGYTNAAYGWMAGYNGGLTSYLNFVKEGGDLENERYFAIGLIMKGLYYQMYTDTFGMLPYTEASDPDIITPVYDNQAEIYKGIIDELNTAMQIIGDHPNTGEGVDLLTKNDLFFNGDLQKWKKLANTLKLRLALRALGAPDAGFADTAINEAMQSDVLMHSDENALMEKDIEISQWANAAYGDVWWNFGGLGSKWNVGKTLIDYLRNNNDPRLSIYANPIESGEVVINKPGSGGGADNFDLYIAFILSQLDDAGVNYTANATSEKVSIVVADDKPYYVGQPTRLNGEIKFAARYELFSSPADIVVNKKNNDTPISPEIVMTAAEGNLLKAEAIVKGFGSGGDAQSFYQEG
ncbi:MAG: SusD/RagB family nutrient-binding outer membrane lipoprotein, partial [Flavobacteriaceae bacterium]|nr:SusD/RagB family nutrient-binding outer membrane lipoprotein [Flavobacteriaceae bacterium]